jgi:DNA-binding Lrp family transcriptional regulator
LGYETLESVLPEKIDEVDLRIIDLLQDDSRLSFNKIATKLGISVGTAYNHIKSLEEKGILKGYTVLVDPVKLGYAMTALILIQAEGAHLSDVESEVAKIDNVVSVYDITGDFDVAVTARFRDRAGLNDFIKKLLATPYVKRTVTNIILNVVKEDIRLKIH